MLVYFIRKCKAFATRKVNANMRHTLALLLPLLLYGCAPSGDSKKTIVASFYPIAFLASEITGNEFEVKTLVPAGSEPHEFELTPRGVAALNDASLILMNGLGMEAWESSLSPSMKEKTITLSQGLETLSIDGRVDPHVWLDTRLFTKVSFPSTKNTRKSTLITMLCFAKRWWIYVDIAMKSHLHSSGNPSP